MDTPSSSRITLKEAIKTIPVDSHRYQADLPLDHCYIKTAHGGLLVSVIVSALHQHFGTTLRSYGHPHTFDIETIFVRPAASGTAIVEIQDVKLGTSVSIVHFRLVQHGKERVVGYASNMNLNAEEGISFPQHDILTPRPASAEIAKLMRDADPHWVGWTIPWHPASFLKPVTHFRFYTPIHATPQKNITDVWMRFASEDERFTTDMLGSVADHWRRMLENYRPGSAWNGVEISKNAIRAAAEGTPFKGYSTSYAYPTLSMHLEVKKLLPSQGVQWLFLRARSTEIKNGRFDAEITILDERLELVALSHQVSFVLGSTQIPDDGAMLKHARL
ncbi:hypothetical protein MMC11_007285 [Xylographa trunciseda]|nr:hypothetical protein [Xylographa trunciseda]